MHFESEIFSLLQKDGLRSVHFMFGAWTDHGRIVGLWSVESSFCWQKQLADLSLKLWSGRIAACSEISLLLLLHFSLRNEFVTLSWLALNYIVGHESVTAVPARFCTIQCCNLSRLATRLPSPIVFCILRLGVDIWCCLFSLKVETKHACAHHTGSITFCRSKLVFGVWGTCIFRNLFFARVCTPPNLWQVFDLCHPCWTWVSKKTWRHGYCERERIRTRFPTEQNYAHTHDSTLRNQRWIRHVSCHTALSAFACCSGCRRCVAWIVTVCICLQQCPLRGCRRFSRVRGTVDAVDVVLAVFLLLLPLVFFSNNFIGKLFVWIIFTIPPATSAPACPRTTF